MVQNVSQQPTAGCTECSELGHTRKQCPNFECRICHNLGHLSYNCEQRHKCEEETEEQHGEEGDEIHANETTTKGEEQRNTENPTKDQPKNMEFEEKAHGLKRHHTTDSEWDGKTPSRRAARMNPTLNLKGRRKRES